MAGPQGRPPVELPDVRRVIAWRGLSAGLAEATTRGVPIVCLAEHSWSNGAQRLALVLGQEDDTRELLESSFVPILLDPEERPDLAARLRWASSVLTGTSGPPLLALLTPHGEPFLTYCSLHPEGQGPYPSLRSLLRSIAQLASERRAAIEEEAKRLQERSRPPSNGDAATPLSGSRWEALLTAVDERFGGLRELPKHPRAPLLWQLLEEAGRAPVGAHLLRTLEGMQRGGVCDQLEVSFHRCSRDERWVVPHFEKLAPQNAALAAVYARAGQQFERPDFSETARTAAAFATAGLDEGVMAIASDTAYYTWTPQAFQAALDPAQVQALGLHFNITRDDSAHTLFRALEPDAMVEFADEPVEVLRERVRQGRALLRLVRSQRPPPAQQRIEAPSWHAETLRWLFEAARYLPQIDAGRLEPHLEGLLAGPFDAELGYARSGEYWLQDQAAIAAACLAAAHTLPAARQSAERLATIILGAYRSEASGPLTDTPRGAHPSQDVVDHALGAAVPSVIDTLRSLAARLGDRDSARDDGHGDGGSGRAGGGERFADAARRLEHCHAAAMLAAQPTEAAPAVG